MPENLFDSLLEEIDRNYSDADARIATFHRDLLTLRQSLPPLPRQFTKLGEGLAEFDATVDSTAPHLSFNRDEWIFLRYSVFKGLLLEQFRDSDNYRVIASKQYKNSRWQWHQQGESAYYTAAAAICAAIEKDNKNLDSFFESLEHCWDAVGPTRHPNLPPDYNVEGHGRYSRDAFPHKLAAIYYACVNATSARGRARRLLNRLIHTLIRNGLFLQFHDRALIYPWTLIPLRQVAKKVGISVDVLNPLYSLVQNEIWTLAQEEIKDRFLEDLRRHWKGQDWSIDIRIDLGFWSHTVTIGLNTFRDGFVDLLINFLKARVDLVGFLLDPERLWAAVRDEAERLFRGLGLPTGVGLGAIVDLAKDLVFTYLIPGEILDMLLGMLFATCIRLAVAAYGSIDYFAWAYLYWEIHLMYECRPNTLDTKMLKEAAKALANKIGTENNMLLIEWLTLRCSDDEIRDVLKDWPDASRLTESHDVNQWAKIDYVWMRNRAQQDGDVADEQRLKKVRFPGIDYMILRRLLDLDTLR